MAPTDGVDNPYCDYSVYPGVYLGLGESEAKMSKMDKSILFCTGLFLGMTVMGATDWFVWKDARNSYAKVTDQGITLINQLENLNLKLLQLNENTQILINRDRRW